MNVTCSPLIERIIEEHGKLVAQFKYPEAKLLIQNALISCYEQSPMSLDIALLLDELALDCKALEQFDEASMYLAQSLAIKKLLFGLDNSETIAARQRLAHWVRSGRVDELKVHEALDNFLLNLKLGPQTDGDMLESSELPKRRARESATARKIRCLVIAKKPKTIYFGDECRSADYTVVCEDGQIGCLSPAVKLELGQEIEASPLQIHLGRLVLTLHRDFVPEQEVIVTTGSESD